MSLLRERAGNVTVELGLLAPILAAMVIGLIDISTAYSDKLRLEQVAQRSVERVMQNSFTTSQETVLEAEAAAAAGTGATANLTFWLECNGTKMNGASAYTAGCAPGQAYARYVQMEVVKNYTPLILSTLAGPNMGGNIGLNGKAGIRIQ